MPALLTPRRWYAALGPRCRLGLALGVAVTVGLAGLSWAVYLWGVVVQSEPPDRIWWEVSLVLDLGREQTLPAWWSSALWLTLGIAAVVSGRVSDRHRRRWFALGALALAASVDEYAELHERLDHLGGVMQQNVGWQLAYAWVLPGALIALAVGILGLALVRAESPHVRTGLLIGGALFLLGALGLEVVGSLLLQHHGAITWHFALAYHVEEILEMLGVLIALITVLTTLEATRADGHWRVRRRAPAGPAPAATERR